MNKEDFHASFLKRLRIFSGEEIQVKKSTSNKTLNLAKKSVH
jgi:hypothetical protein